MPPTFVLRRSRKKPRWTDRDRLLLLAWQMYEDSLCMDCGQERGRAFNPDMDGWFTVHAETCFSCKALEDERAKQEESKRSRKEYVIDARPADRPLLPWTPDLTPS